jgi:hypothetical protein
LLYINIRMLIAGQLGPLRYVFVFIMALPMLLFGLLAAPIGREQPTEVWVLSRVRFFVKPRLRIWNQMGALELVTITVPKKMERQLTKDFSQREVRSRLKALATTMDSRGWAVRNVAVNLNANPSYLDITDPDSDRLVAGSNLPQSQVATDVNESDDIMDAQNNATAQHFETLMQEEDVKRKQKVSQLISNTKSAPTQDPVEEEPEPDYGILDKIKLGKKETTSFVSHSVVNPGSDIHDDSSTESVDQEIADAEKAYLEKEHQKAAEVHAKSAGFKLKGREITDESEPLAKGRQDRPQKDDMAMTKATQNANLKELSQSGNDLSVASVQKLANRNSENIKQISDNEVEIDLGH